MVFLSISIGSTPATARPLLASTDPDLVRDTLRAMMGRVEDAGASAASIGGVLPLHPRTPA